LRRAVAVDLADACVYKLKLNGGDGGEKKAFQKEETGEEGVEGCISIVIFLYGYENRVLLGAIFEYAIIVGNW
jgi:hypothetical protein